MQPDTARQVLFHVAGARNVTREEFLAAFADVETLEVSSENDWCWIQAGGEVSTSTIDACLAKTRGVGLRVSSEAGRWWLRITKGEQAFHSCVSMHYLKSLADSGASANPAAPVDPDQEAWLDVTQEFLVLQAGEITGALLRFEIPYDREAVWATLLGESVSKGELNSELGNLPRFLAGMGINMPFGVQD